MKILWLKLDVEIFNNAKIKKLRRMAGGNEYFVLWVGLLTLGMKCAKYGVLEISDGLPYTPEDFAEEFDLTVESVKQGLDLFERLGMIKAIDGGTVEICDFRKHQNIERIEQVRELARARQAKRREKLQLTHDSKMLEYKELDKDKAEEEAEESSRESRVTKEQNSQYDKIYKDNMHNYKLDKAYYQARNKTNSQMLKDYTFDEILKALPIYLKTKKEKENLYLFPLRISEILASKTREISPEKQTENYIIR